MVLARYAIVDFRMRKIEKEYIKNMGYVIIENEFNNLVYDEISSHPDIYYTNVDNHIFISKDKAKEFGINPFVFKLNIGDSVVSSEYPKDVAYNLCIIGKNAIHNFKYTDPILKKYLEENDYNLIQVEQGYSKCSIVVIDSNSCITSDIKIATVLLENGIDVLYVDEPEIKLLKRMSNTFKEGRKMSFEYSDMKGFIGGSIFRLDDKIIVFGDVKKFINYIKIKKFVEKRGLELIGFEGLDVIDYGGIIEVKDE